MQQIKLKKNDIPLFMQEGKQALLVEEDKADGKGGDVAETEDESLEVWRAQVAAIADFAPVELAIKFPTCKDADEHSAKGQKHHARKVIEEGKDVAAEELDARQRTEGQGAAETQNEDGARNDECALAARKLELLCDVSGCHLMKRDGTGQCGHEEQKVEQGGEAGGEQRPLTKGLLKDVGQGDEGKAGPRPYLVGIHTNVEH